MFIHIFGANFHQFINFDYVFVVFSSASMPQSCVCLNFRTVVLFLCYIHCVPVDVVVRDLSFSVFASTCLLLFQY